MTMNRVAAGRQLLVDALVPTMTGNLDGRVEPYRVAGRPAAPSMWIELNDPCLRKDNGSIVASYAVLGVADGASHAQQALVDEMISRAWDACQAAAGLKPVRVAARDIQVAVKEDGQPAALRGFVLTVDHTINATTLCTPDVESVTVPAHLVEVT